MFIDRAKIHVQGGDGGNGVTAFRREKFVPRGGPSGGDGGRGGDVWVVADSSLNTLLHLRYNPEHIAERGLHGEGSNRSGRDGEDHTIRVPVGTQIFDSTTGELLHDLALDGARWLAAGAGEEVLEILTSQPQRIARLAITKAAARVKSWSCSSS